MHGTPGSRLGPLPRASRLYGLGVRLITFDRPGYGGSERLESRLVADVVPDVEAIADALEIGRFAVLGRSGGGPHALACAALLPGRVTRAGILVGLAPWTADGLDWFAGMSESNVREFTAAATKPEELTADLVRTAAEIRADPASHVAALGPELPEPDRRVIADAGLRALLADNFAEALRELRRRLDRRLTRVLLTVGIRTGGHQGAGAGLAWPETMSSRRWRTPAGWPTRSLVASMSHPDRAPRTSPRFEVVPEVLSWLIRKCPRRGKSPGHVGCDSSSPSCQCPVPQRDDARVAPRQERPGDLAMAPRTCCCSWRPPPPARRPAW